MNIPSLSPEILFYLGSLPISNAFFWSIVLSSIIIFIVLYISFTKKEIPGRIQSLLELFLEGLYGFTNSVTQDKKRTRILFPLIAALFLFIFICNIFPFLPGQSALQIKTQEGFVPIFRSVMSDYGMVLVLTLIAVIGIQIATLAVNGPIGYLGKFINIKKVLKAKTIGDFAYGLLDVFLGLMEIVGEFAKVLSLSFRLFGNIFAGEVLTAVMLFLMPFFAPLPFLFLGLLSAIIQAFVFATLTLVFINMGSEKIES